MTKLELLEALKPFDDETFIAIRLKTTGDMPFEMPIFAVDYVPMENDRDAYIALRCNP